MATLRLKFPEKAEPTTLVLSGSRVTLGRLPLNTIQIIDRTLSGFHAEFVLEDDHYRLHDRGSTNGTFVNNETVTDFHLREACKISFGSLECEYSPESPAAADSANLEALPTRSEINAVRQENAELKTRADSLREEIETLNKTRGPETGAGTIAVAKDEYDKVIAERDALKDAQRFADQKIERLEADLAQLQRDRESLKRIADDAKAEIASLNPPLPPVSLPEEPAPLASAPVEAAPPEPEPPAAAAEEPTPAPTIEPAVAAPAVIAPVAVTPDLPFVSPPPPRPPQRTAEAILSAPDGSPRAEARFAPRRPDQTPPSRPVRFPSRSPSRPPHPPRTRPAPRSLPRPA